MFDTILRPLKDQLSTPIARLIEKRASPTAITIASFIAGCACAGLLMMGMNWAAFVLWVLNRVLDGLDGLVARRTGKASDFGGYMDIVLDFAIYALVPLAMALRSPLLSFPCALLLGAAYINGATWMYLAALLEKRGRDPGAVAVPTSVAMPVGIVEGTETVIIYTLMIVIPSWRRTLFIFAAALILAGAVLRFYQGLRTLRAAGPPKV